MDTTTKAKYVVVLTTNKKSIFCVKEFFIELGEFQRMQVL